MYDTSGLPGAHVIAVLALPSADQDLIPRSETELQLLSTLAADRLRPLLLPGEHLSLNSAGHELVLSMDRLRPSQVQRRLDQLAQAMTAEPFGPQEHPRPWLEVGIGWSFVPAGARSQAQDACYRSARSSAHDALRQRDLVAKRAGGRDVRRRGSRWGLVLQIALTLCLASVIPFGALVVAEQHGLDLAGPLYLVVVAVLGITALLMWLESLHALLPDQPPSVDLDQPAPPASAIIAAYLPNEADTIVETLTHFLAQEYSGGLQVVLAYNTPVRLPVEEEIQALAARDPRLTMLRVENSTSKAQNVNAALGLVTGEFVGVFDADHHPLPGTFDRAWAWLHSGYDVVQGHCVVRNGHQSWVARLVAVEFEQIYAVTHPGRASLNGFGIFGGSNGYWRTSALRSIRMRTDRLTEDIDSSIRATLAGFRVASDPGLLSLELAPVTLRSLWRQRMRWSQGWMQVSRSYLGRGLVDPQLSPRQRLGMAVLLGWRELVPWFTPLILPLLAFQYYLDGTVTVTEPFLLLTVFTLTTGPVQTLVAAFKATPSMRRHRWWFVFYALATVVFYSELKNLIMRVAQIKNLCGEHEWTVTPRAVAATVSVAPRGQAVAGDRVAA